MKSIRQTSNTTVIKYNNYDEFQHLLKQTNRYVLGCLTLYDLCISAYSYISSETKIVKENEGTYIYDLIVFSDSSYVSCQHKKLKVYYTKRGGYYAKTRFGRAWLNSFFELPRNGDYERILTGAEVIEKEILK